MAPCVYKVPSEEFLAAPCTYKVPSELFRTAPCTYKVPSEKILMPPCVYQVPSEILRVVLGQSKVPSESFQASPTLVWDPLRAVYIKSRVGVFVDHKGGRGAETSRSLGSITEGVRRAHPQRKTQPKSGLPKKGKPYSNKASISAKRPLRSSAMSLDSSSMRPALVSRSDKSLMRRFSRNCVAACKER